jgi:predicted house-cleaning noncanonical NTP pyrophosphatase (MazG superfamily)
MEQDIIELFIDEENDFSGIEAISIVEYPAIEEDFIALKEQTIQLAEVDAEKRILMGAALIPDRKIFRKSGDKEYFIYFSKDTVRRASELFLSKGKQNNSTLEHDVELDGLSVVESWIIEDEKKDKSAKYNLNLPVGTWMVSVKVNNDQIWEEFVKEGKVKGFSIEGFFTDKLDERPRESVKEEIDSEELEALAKIFELEDIILSQYDIELETYSDYPKAARNNARRALKYKEENGSSCGTPVGWRRASQLASGANLSRSTIARMASFKRHQQNKDVPYSEGCGGIMWDAWGGSAGINWAISKLKQIDKKKLAKEFVPVNDDYIIIDNRLAFATKEMAEEKAADLGCEGYHEHEVEGKMWFMPCVEHNLKEDDPCQAGYTQYGMKKKNGRLVPNCIPDKK